jgi:hypothetical protein
LGIVFFYFIYHHILRLSTREERTNKTYSFLPTLQTRTELPFDALVEACKVMTKGGDRLGELLPNKILCVPSNYVPFAKSPNQQL